MKKQASGVLLFIGFCICFLFFVGSNHSLPQLVGFGFLLVVSRVFLSKDNWRLFLSFFLVSIILSRLLLLDFLIQNGTPYIGGGDDEFFSEMAIYYAQNKVDLEDPLYLAMPYKLFLFTLSSWVQIVAFLSNDTISHTYHTSLLMLNSFTGALAILNVKKLIVYCGLDLKLNYLSSLLIFFNPFLLYYSSVLLREIIVVYFLSWFFAVLISGSTTKFKVLIGLICFVAVFFLRPSNAVLIPMSSLVYYLLHLRSGMIRVLSITLLIFIAFMALPYVSAFTGKDVISARDSYIELGVEQASDNSIGVKLIQSSNPLIKLVLPLYILLSPIPPPIFSNLSFTSFLISIGSISWAAIVIVLLPKLFIMYRMKEKLVNLNEPLFDYLFVLMIVCLFHVVLVSITSGDSRHLLIVYPFVTPIALYEFRKIHFIQYSMYYKLVGFLGLAALLTYVFIKFI